MTVMVVFAGLFSLVVMAWNAMLLRDLRRIEEELGDLLVDKSVCARRLRELESVSKDTLQALGAGIEMSIDTDTRLNRFMKAILETYPKQTTTPHLPKGSSN